VSTLKERLRQVIDEKRVRSQRWWSEQAGLESVQVNQWIKREDFVEARAQIGMVLALADVAGVSPAWLAWGIGTPDDDPPFPTLIMRIRRQPGLEAAIERHPARWRTSTIAQASAMTFQCDDAGVPLGGWEKALDAIESGRHERTRGKAADVTRATRKQVGRRPKLPKST
jgi:hypothetical protein